MNKVKYLEGKVNILGHVRQQLGAEDENDTSKDNLIEVCSPYELFDYWMTHEGIIGYSGRIWHMVWILQEMKKESDEENNRRRVSGDTTDRA